MRGSGESTGGTDCDQLEVSLKSQLHPLHQFCDDAAVLAGTEVDESEAARQPAGEDDIEPLCFHLLYFRIEMLSVDGVGDMVNTIPYVLQEFSVHIL